MSQGRSRTDLTEVEEADISVVEKLAPHRQDPVVRAAAKASELADQLPLMALSGAVLVAGLLARRPTLARAGRDMAASALAAAILKTVVKKSVSRTRPHLLLDDNLYEVEAGGPDEGPWHSFPSGHTAGAVAAARAFARNYPSAGVLAYAAAAGVAAAQIPRAAHYPSDVAAGMLLGLAADALSRRAVQAIARRLPPTLDLERLGQDGPVRAERRSLHPARGEGHRDPPVGIDGDEAALPPGVADLRDHGARSRHDVLSGPSQAVGDLGRGGVSDEELALPRAGNGNTPVSPHPGGNQG